jgi:hypothetical protein
METMAQTGGGALSQIFGCSTVDISKGLSFPRS